MNGSQKLPAIKMVLFFSQKIADLHGDVQMQYK